jgi:hypothetical protein
MSINTLHKGDDDDDDNNNNVVVVISCQPSLGRSVPRDKVCYFMNYNKTELG